MTPEGIAELALFERLRTDPTLTNLLGGEDRIVPGWPVDTTEPEDFPRVTFYVFGPPPVAKGVQRVRVSADEWVWPEGHNGGRRRLLEIDSRIVELIGGADWTHDEHWIAGSVFGFRDFPGGPDEPLRRLRELVLDVTTT